MPVVRIYHKAGTTPVKADAATIKAAREHLSSGQVRVPRPELADLFIPARAGTRSAFYRLPAVPASVIDNPYRRQAEHKADSWAVPVSCLGRKAEATASTAQSILLWIKKNLPAVVDAASVSVVVEED